MSEGTRPAAAPGAIRAASARFQRRDPGDCSDAGYESHESFTRAFRAMFGESPSEFRDNRRELRGGGPASPPDSFGVQVESLGAMRLAFVRHVGPFPLVGIAWQKLSAWAGRKGLLAGAPGFVGVIHDDPEITPPERLRYDAALPVEDGACPEGKVGIQNVPPCEYAVTRHTGPYDTLYLTYGRLCGEWLPASGREVRERPSLEFYRNSPMTAPPTELITDIYMPLEEECL